MSLAEEDGFEVLVRELGRINGELTAQRRLSAEVAHDLAAPAHVILGLSEILLDYSELLPDVRKRVEQIQSTARTMAALVDELRCGLDLGIEEGLHLEEYDVTTFVASVVERSRVLAATKDIEFTFASSLPETTRVQIDGPRFDRALTNVMSNAIKFSPSHSKVSVSLSSDDSHVSIAIADEGPGITDEGRAHIFEAFHREQSTSHVPGLGLGLNVVRQVLQSHGGEVKVLSEVGAGATFVLRLPKKP